MSISLKNWSNPNISNGTEKLFAALSVFGEIEAAPGHTSKQALENIKEAIHSMSECLLKQLEDEFKNLSEQLWEADKECAKLRQREPIPEFNEDDPLPDDIANRFFTLSLLTSLKEKNWYQTILIRRHIVDELWWKYRQLSVRIRQVKNQNIALKNQLSKSKPDSQSDDPNVPF